MRSVLNTGQWRSLPNSSQFRRRDNEDSESEEEDRDNEEDVDAEEEEDIDENGEDDQVRVTFVDGKELVDDE
jgi:predicted RNA polymerase sigma factor